MRGEGGATRWREDTAIMEAVCASVVRDFLCDVESHKIAQQICTSNATDR